MTHCCECHFQYQLVRNARLAAERRARCWSLSRWFLKRSFLGFALVQTVLCLIALGLRAIDRHEVLVTWFNLPHVQDAPKPGEGDFWSAIRYHKTTYYLAAILVSLIVLGIAVVIAALVDRASARRICSRACPRGSRRCYFYWVLCGANSDQCVSLFGNLYNIVGLAGLAAVGVAFVGLFALVVGLTLAAQIVYQRYLEVRERGLLVNEFMVEDLSHQACSIAGNPGHDEEEGVSPEVVQERIQCELQRELRSS
eukprot:TRINITY_DN58510_c0_g1_i1.p1 TRINITY_DN58510_c0_g1~~TRINITY_DN58510_c0_g1_i1.p1  ORF type:complete len:254 (+),score=20.64 TRINITY_DN58510_c0_g1_i1:278-1039(+)